MTNTRMEAANTTIKNIERAGPDLRNPENHRTRTLLTSAARRAA